MSNRFERAKDALYNAFFNGTLAKGTCAACAIGNMVAAGMGATVEKVIINERNEVMFNCDDYNSYWQNLFCTNFEGTQKRAFSDQFKSGKGLNDKLVAHTGYNDRELAKVEHAFERNTKIIWYNYHIRSEQEVLEDQYNGLVAVFDVLLELEGITEGDHREKLRTHPKLQSI